MMRCLVTVVIGVLVGMPAAAQTPPPPDSAERMMRGALRMLATVQEVHYAKHRTYTTDIAALRRMPGVSIDPSVQLAIWSASSDGYAMEARHAALAGQSCVYYVGKPGSIPEVLTQGRRLPGSARMGRVTCDFDPSN